MNRFRPGLLLAALLLGSPLPAYRTRRMPVPSAAMGTAPQATVVLPDAYAKGRDRYPVVYVLHGWSGSDQAWTTETTIAKLADQYRVILVMPDGGYDKWYLDSPVLPEARYETYVGKEVVDFVDHTFRTRAHREGRAITGLSMGGFGALNVALNYPATFAAAGSLSGGVDPRPFPTQWGLEKVFGDPTANGVFWTEKAIITNAQRFRESGIALALDCGVDDFFLEVNRALHQRLVELKVPHDYTERPGGHTWDYWENAIRYQMLFFSGHLNEREKKGGK